MAKTIWIMGCFHALAWVDHKWLRPHDFTTDDLGLYALYAAITLPLVLLIEWGWRFYLRRCLRSKYMARLQELQADVDRGMRKAEGESSS